NSQTVCLPTATCWFHATRVHSEKSFSEGLLPLPDNLNIIWPFLNSLVAGQISSSDWDRFLEDLNGDPFAFSGAKHAQELFIMKTKKMLYKGPCGSLVRELIDIPKQLGNHDYLDAPEIIEDICDCFEDRFQIDLMLRYKQNTVPTIVKFFTDGCDMN